MELLADIAVPAMTGDDANVLLFVVLGVVAVAVLVVLAFKDKIFKK